MALLPFLLCPRKRLSTFSQPIYGFFSCKIDIRNDTNFTSSLCFPCLGNDQNGQNGGQKYRWPIVAQTILSLFILLSKKYNQFKYNFKFKWYFLKLFVQGILSFPSALLSFWLPSECFFTKPESYPQHSWLKIILTVEVINFWLYVKYTLPYIRIICWFW